MEYRRMGKTGLQLSALSFGTWVTFGNQIDNEVSEDLLKLAYEQGINFFDNAEAYANGQSEIVMGNILKKTGWDRSTYVVSSKVFWGGEKPNQKGLMRKHIVEACHAALKRLQVDYLDLFYCHRPDVHTPIAETVWTMHHLIQQGKVLYWGTSEWSAQQITEAHYVAERYKLIGPVMEQPQYNMFERQKMEAEFLPLFSNFGLGTTTFSPLASGLLTGKYLKSLPEGSRMQLKDLDWLKRSALTESKQQKVAQLQQIADEMGVSLAQLSIAWCLKNPHVSSVILGASRPEQLLENLGALEVVKNITPEVQEKIETILGNKPQIQEF